MPSVVVTILSASELNVPQGSAMTPYVEIEYARAKRTTTTARDSAEPAWNERFLFDVVEGEDEMAFNVFLPGGVFVGKALLSFAKFGVDADLCFELADANNEVGGKLIIRVEPAQARLADDVPVRPEPTPTPAAPVAVSNGTTPVEVPKEVPKQQPAPTPPATQPPQQAGPKTRLSISKVQMVGAEDCTCVLRVGTVQKVCDTNGAEEYLFSLHPEDDVVIEVLSQGQPFGSATLKGSVVASRSGTNSWVVVSNISGHHVGKLLLTVSSVKPVEAQASPLDSRGCETNELVIVVVAAEKLPQPCNACVYLSIGDNDRATTKKANTSGPVWNEKFTFFVEEEDTLSAKVFDDEDFVAEAIVPISELLYVAGVHQQLEVKLLDRKRRNAGLLILGAELAFPRRSVPTVSSVGHSSVIAVPPPVVTKVIRHPAPPLAVPLAPTTLPGSTSVVATPIPHDYPLVNMGPPPQDFTVIRDPLPFTTYERSWGNPSTIFQEELPMASSSYISPGYHQSHPFRPMFAEDGYSYRRVDPIYPSLSLPPYMEDHMYSELPPHTSSVFHGAPSSVGPFGPNTRYGGRIRLGQTVPSFPASSMIGSAYGPSTWTGSSSPRSRSASRTAKA